ncbi:MAG: glycine oxidase ThiO [Mycobacterium pseudokansasii]|uniref:glycine oxidase n=1 Tax=Mycobacterium pseudokansasii TaxID=2341080 RepID=A0A498QLQ2_9MYCO|nr:glycine oxidase ThiO [Mycobacterium pseudokansasii]KZS61119.1 glycine oxidase ThiO [Mycobacterium kansasii]MBY0387002.1 glycine oxidase ThiO [Mycobacterium pseudokansasii]VAZ88897.1 Glycine oxidase [Mycobacterium pseudokansasii]VAZ89393.1 Glycine oxidase [Mycobacterium pseudokansasii]VBA47032.1 Glycine oxidase [Mycobacterium pseudokansasii]
MSAPTPAGSLAVIGGGVIGLSVARRAARAGWSVRVHRSGEPGASWVAGGMIAPHSEGWPGEERLLRLGLESLRLWHDGGFLDGLPSHVVTARESLVVAVDRADVADLHTVADWLSQQGHPVVWESAARDVEPLLAQGIRHGFRAPTELAVDNRALLDALIVDCERLGVAWAAPVTGLSDAQGDVVVIANGIDAPALWPGLPVRPVKGEVLRLRWRKGCMPLSRRVIRARVHGRQVYLVPRADGVVVGATQYEHGRDTAPVVSGVRDLLDDACAVLPALGEYELAECSAGLRPMTPDNLPIVQRLDARTLVAAGHGRSGFLLAPWTAEQIMSELAAVGASA